MRLNITSDEPISDEFKSEIEQHIKAKYGSGIVGADVAILHPDSGGSDVIYTAYGVKFERIRRITGYLGTLDTWNDAKRAEERDRVKHDLPDLADCGDDCERAYWRQYID